MIAMARWTLRCYNCNFEFTLSFAKTLEGHKSRPVTMLQARPHAIHFKRILDFGEDSR